MADVYQKATGDLKITKTFGGDVTKEEVASGAITFEVKTSDGKWLDKDGKLSDEKVELTLGEADGFVASKDGKTWTKEFTGVPAGKYTVTEANSAEAKGTVVAGKTATLELKDVYQKEQDGPKKSDTETKVGTSTGTKVSGGSLPKTGDPAVATGLAAICLTALGSGLLTGGLYLRKRRKDDTE